MGSCFFIGQWILTTRQRQEDEVRMMVIVLGNKLLFNCFLSDLNIVIVAVDTRAPDLEAAPLIADERGNLDLLYGTVMRMLER